MNHGRIIIKEPNERVPLLWSPEGTFDYPREIRSSSSTIHSSRSLLISEKFLEIEATRGSFRKVRRSAAAGLFFWKEKTMTLALAKHLAEESRRLASFCRKQKLRMLEAVGGVEGESHPSYSQKTVYEVMFNLEISKRLERVLCLKESEGALWVEDEVDRRLDRALNPICPICSKTILAVWFNEHLLSCYSFSRNGSKVLEINQVLIEDCQDFRRHIENLGIGELAQFSSQNKVLGFSKEAMVKSLKSQKMIEGRTLGRLNSEVKPLNVGRFQTELRLDSVEDLDSSASQAGVDRQISIKGVIEKSVWGEEKLEPDERTPNSRDLPAFSRRLSNASPFQPIDHPLPEASRLAANSSSRPSANRSSLLARSKISECFVPFEIGIGSSGPRGIFKARTLEFTENSTPRPDDRPLQFDPHERFDALAVTAPAELLGLSLRQDLPSPDPSGLVSELLAPSEPVPDGPKSPAELIEIAGGSLLDISAGISKSKVSLKVPSSSSFQIGIPEEEQIIPPKQMTSASLFSASSRRSNSCRRRVVDLGRRLDLDDPVSLISPRRCPGLQLKSSQARSKTCLRGFTSQKFLIFSLHVRIREYCDSLQKKPMEENFIEDCSLLLFLDDLIATNYLDSPEVLDSIHVIMKNLRRRIDAIRKRRKAFRNLLSFDLPNARQRPAEIFISGSCDRVDRWRKVVARPKIGCSLVSLAAPAGSPRHKPVLFSHYEFLQSDHPRCKSDSQLNKERQRSQLYRLKTDNISLDGFEIVQKIGSGAFSEVFLALQKSSREMFALKIISLDGRTSSSDLTLLKNEIDILKKLKGNFLAQAYFSFIQNDQLVIVMEYYTNGNLREKLDDEARFELPAVLFYATELVLAVEEAHKEAVHRDIKPANLLLDSKGHLKLSDFGLSELYQKKIPVFLKKMGESDYDLRGTFDYIPPEVHFPERNFPPKYHGSDKKISVFKSKRSEENLIRIERASASNKDIRVPGSRRTVRVPEQFLRIDTIIDESNTAYRAKRRLEVIDWWAVGCLIYEFACGISPFSGKSNEEVLERIREHSIEWPEIGYEEDEMTPETQDLIRKLLSPNPLLRLGINGALEIKQHPFFKNVNWNDAEKLLIPVPQSPEVERKPSIFRKMSLRRQHQTQVINLSQVDLNMRRWDLLFEKGLEKLADIRSQLQQLRESTPHHL